MQHKMRSLLTLTAAIRCVRAFQHVRGPAHAVRALSGARGEGCGGLFEDVTGLVGNTPVVRVSERMGVPAGVEVYAKCEYFNPLSSVKDRLAVAIIEDAEASGALKPGMTVVEATSGNTGIAVAMVCAQRGYDCVICMAEPFSVERRRLMRMLGAKVRPARQPCPGRLSAPGPVSCPSGDRHAQGGQGDRHGAQGGGALRQARLVPVPPV